VALIGAAGWALVFLVALAGTSPAREDDPRVTKLLGALVGFGLVFTLRLKYGEFVVLRSFCRGARSTPPSSSSTACWSSSTRAASTDAAPPAPRARPPWPPPSRPTCDRRPPPGGRDAPDAARRVLVAGAGAGNLKSAVALNLAAALAAGGTAVRLRDLDGASARALAALARPAAPGAAAPDVPPGRASGGWRRVRLPWAAVDLAVADPAVADAAVADAAAAVLPRAAVEIVDPPPRFDAAVRALAASAPLVLVPVDASPLALRVLAEVAPVVAAGGGRLRVVLSRRLPARRPVGARRPARPARARRAVAGHAAARAARRPARRRALRAGHAGRRRLRASRRRRARAARRRRARPRRADAAPRAPLR
jgi:hypothetical protein